MAVQIGLGALVSQPGETLYMDFALSCDLFEHGRCCDTQFVSSNAL